MAEIYHMVPAALWQAARGGYRIVLAPEGVPSVSVSYTSFLAPLLLWIGAALLAVRLTRLALARDGRRVAPLIRPIGRRLSPLIGGAMSRQRGRMATGLALVLLAVALLVLVLFRLATARGGRPL